MYGPEEERPSLLKYWLLKIYIVSLLLDQHYFFIVFGSLFFADWILYYGIRYFYLVTVVHMQSYSLSMFTLFRAGFYRAGLGWNISEKIKAMTRSLKDR